MKKYQLKSPETVSVIGMTFEGDYIVLDGTISALGDYEVKVVPKADFESKYAEVVEAQPAAAQPSVAQPAAAQPSEATASVQPTTTPSHLV